MFSLKKKLALDFISAIPQFPTGFTDSAGFYSPLLLPPHPVREEMPGKEWRGEKGGQPPWMGADSPKSLPRTLM